MDTERTVLSCPGRLQDWLDAAADQVETLLGVPQPSLSGSDQTIGALRLEHEGPSWTAGPYGLQSANIVSGVFPVTDQVPSSVSYDQPLFVEKSPSRCESCVDERGRCSRDLPSCTRCWKKGFFCFYMEGVPTGRRKPQTKTRNHVWEEELGLPVESSPVVSALEYPALLETHEAVAAQCHLPDTCLLQAVSQYAQPPLEEYPTFPTRIPSVWNSTNPLDQTVVTKRQTTMLPATPTFSTLSRRASKLEITREIARVELRSRWSDAIADGLNPGSMRRTALGAAARSLCQDPGSEEERKAFEDVLQKCADNEIRTHTAHLAAFPFQLQYPSHERTSTTSSIASTPFASTLASRSTSRSSGTNSLPITPGTELPSPLDRIDTQRVIDASITASQASSVPHTASFDLHETSAANDVEARLLHMEQLVDLYLLSHHRHQAAYETASGVVPWDGPFSDRFVDELFEEGNAAKSLVELQQRSPKKGHFSRS